MMQCPIYDSVRRNSENLNSDIDHGVPLFKDSIYSFLTGVPAGSTLVQSVRSLMLKTPSRLRRRYCFAYACILVSLRNY